MENASKALIIAGGILLAMMVLAIFLFLINSARGFAETQNDKAEASSIDSFNRFYYSFESEITGIDVLNIYNKVQEDSANDHYINFYGNSVNITLLDQQAKDGLGSDAYKYINKKFRYSATDSDRDGYIDTINIS